MVNAATESLCHCKSMTLRSSGPSRDLPISPKMEVSPQEKTAKVNLVPPVTDLTL